MEPSQEKAFPRGSFLTLAITHQHEDPAILLQFFLGESHAESSREPMTFAARGPMNAIGHIQVWMPFEWWIQPLLAQNHVQPPAGVALAQDKFVVRSHDLVIEIVEYLDSRKRATVVIATIGLGQFVEVPSDLFSSWSEHMILWVDHHSSAESGTKGGHGIVDIVQLIAMGNDCV